MTKRPDEIAEEVTRQLTVGWQLTPAGVTALIAAAIRQARDEVLEEAAQSITREPGHIAAFWLELAAKKIRAMKDKP